jgi:hypothetical protein
MDESLSFGSFLETAKKAAERAMNDHGRREYDEFALHAGVAVERLAKAVLVKLNPVFLVEMRNGNTDMLLLFGGADVEVEKSKVRTVGAKDAIQRLRRIDILSKDDQLDLLIELRNGTAHTAGDDSAKSLLVVLARTVSKLLAYLGSDASEFWGSWTKTVSVAMNEHQSQLLRDLQVQIDQARHAFEDRFEGLPDGAMERALEAPHSAQGEWIESLRVMVRGETKLLTHRANCPACEGRGALTYEPTMSSDTNTTFVPTGFSCFLCSFEVHGAEGLEATRQLVGNAFAPTMISSHEHTFRPHMRPSETRAS